MKIPQTPQVKLVGKYYGSELNKLIDEKCTPLMTVNNIDLIIQRLSKNSIRIIESKHTNEGMNKGQRRLLYTLGQKSKTISESIGINFDVYIIRGEYPYNTAKIIRLCDDEEVEINQKKLIEFLNFDKTFEQLQDEEEIIF